MDIYSLIIPFKFGFSAPKHYTTKGGSVKTNFLSDAFLRPDQKPEDYKSSSQLHPFPANPILRQPPSLPASMTATFEAKRINSNLCSSVRQSILQGADSHLCRNPEHKRSTTIPVSLNFQEHLRPDFKIICGAQRREFAKSYLPWKRFQDVICILLCLPILLPILLIIVVWIRLVSGGPALFRQERIGVNGSRSVIYKFRSMKINCGTSRHEKRVKYCANVKPADPSGSPLRPQVGTGWFPPESGGGG